MTTKWTKEEDELLIKLRNQDKIPFDKMGQWLSVSPAACRVRWTQLMDEQLKSQPTRRWTMDDNVLLLELKNKCMSLPEIAAELGRTVRSIESRIPTAQHIVEQNKGHKNGASSTIPVGDKHEIELIEPCVPVAQHTVDQNKRFKHDASSTTTEDETESSDDDDDQPSSDDDDDKPLLLSTMALYDKTIDKPYKERCKVIARYRGWLMEGITNKFLPRTEQVDREVSKCDDLIRLLQE
jgi:hypothetical protein